MAMAERICQMEMVLERIIDWCYSLVFCMRVFPLRDALRMPINISHKVKVGKIRKGCIEQRGSKRHNMVYIGHQGFSAIEESNGLINIEEGGKMIIDGNARFAQGVRLWIDKDATFSIGKNFYCNKNCLFRVMDNVSFGDDVLMGWDIEFNTADGHQICIGEEWKKSHAPIIVGNHVWIGSHVRVTKGAVIPNRCVVAQASLVNKCFKKEHALIGGIPAQVIREAVDWKE